MISALLIGALFTLIHCSDGGVDDFATSALLAASQKIDEAEKRETFNFSTIILTNGDCEPFSALSAYQKMIRTLNIPAKVALSSSRVWNPFPWIWKIDSEKMDRLSIFRDLHANKEVIFEGNPQLESVIRKADSVKIIATGPLTTLADVFKSYPELIKKVSELHWIGGAIDIPGNLPGSPEYPPQLLNEKAEWNVFSDPWSADWIFRNTSFTIFLYPIDLSVVTTTHDFVERLNQKEATPFSSFVMDCYKIVEQVESYRMWDMASTAGLLFPDILTPPLKENLSVVVSKEDEGALIRDKKGRLIHIYMEFINKDPAQFYNKIINILTNPILKM